jgi:hypothetical protein
MNAPAERKSDNRTLRIAGGVCLGIIAAIVVVWIIYSFFYENGELDWAAVIFALVILAIFFLARALRRKK